MVPGYVCAHLRGWLLSLGVVCDVCVTGRGKECNGERAQIVIEEREWRGAHDACVRARAARD